MTNQTLSNQMAENQPAPALQPSTASIIPFVTPRMRQAIAFLTLIHPVRGHLVGFAKKGDTRRQRAFETPEQLVAWQQSFDQQGFNCYHACSTVKDPTLKEGLRAGPNIYASRALWFEVDSRSSKPDKPNVFYANRGEALEATGEFLHKVKLPPPIWVYSGGGPQIYFLLGTELPPDQWRELAHGLQGACNHFKFHADETRTCDVTSILRTPATHHHGTGLLINMQASGGLNPKGYPLEAFDHLRQYASEAKRSSVPGNKLNGGAIADQSPLAQAILGGLNDDEPSDPKIIRQECQQFAAFATDAGNRPNPDWHRWLGVLSYCGSEGVQYAKDLADGYRGFSRADSDAWIDKESTRRKKEAGPTTCEQFEQLCPGGCDGCPHRGEITTPLQLGRELRDDDAAQQQGQQAGPQPSGYFTGPAGLQFGPYPKTDTAAFQIFDAGDDAKTMPPPRAWLLGNQFCRQFVSSLMARGDTGKTAVRIADALALAIGRPITGHYVFHRTRVLLICLEDDINEVRRRVRAACIFHKINPDGLKGWLFYTAPRKARLAVATKTGPQKAELEKMIRDAIKQFDPGLVSIDPLVKAHQLEENDAGAMDFVFNLLTDLAVECNIAVDVAHHARKGPTSPGDADAGRGSSAIKDAGRLVYTLTSMSEDEAKAFGVPDHARSSFIRLDRGKVNLLPSARKTTWFQLVGVDIGNGTREYPSGDNVHTIVPWTPPQTADVLPRAITVFMELLDRFATEGNHVSNSPKSPTYAPAVFAERTDIGKDMFKKAMEELLQRRVIKRIEVYGRGRLIRTPAAEAQPQPQPPA